MLIVSGPVGEATHDGGDHPERPARIGAVMAGIEDLHLEGEVRFLPLRSATPGELARVHSTGYLDELAGACRRGGGQLDPDTFVLPESWSVARQAAGAGLAAVEALERQGDGVAFVVARPPGHHAVGDRAMGFCLLNNVAIAAASLSAAGERVLIIDWDVHHGNGTQSTFWDDPNVLYVSTHQSPLFPGSGHAHETGGVRAPGLTVNIPLPAGATGDVLRRGIDEVAVPVVDAFRPTWVLVSAGFDAHRADPLADLALSSGDFADLAVMVAGMAPRPGRLVLFLEGGYHLGALRHSVTATLGALLGESHRPEAPTTGGPGSQAVTLIGTARQRALASVRPATSARPT